MSDVDGFARSMERALVKKSKSPPRESWQPYTLEATVERYNELLLDGARRPT